MKKFFHGFKYFYDANIIKIMGERRKGKGEGGREKGEG